MINPFSVVLGKISPQAAMLSQVVGALRAAQDPIAELYRMAATNPQMKQVTDVIDQNGGIQQAVYALSRQKGINPEYALEQARQQSR